MARFAVVCPNGTNATPLTVNYTVSGSATEGVDYAALPGSITIPPGVLAANIFVTPLGDYLTTNQVTVTVALTASPNYVLTNLASATATILDWPVDVWQRANFSAAQLANPAISGDAADPAGDGLPNLIKYALGLSPWIAEANPLVPVVMNGTVTLTYPHSRFATDVSLDVEWSPDLMSWYSGPTYVQPVNIVSQATNCIITVQTGTAGATNAAGFFRLRAARL
jgi:hypothetical protein